MQPRFEGSRATKATIGRHHFPEAFYASCKVSQIQLTVGLIASARSRAAPLKIKVSKK
jgi:hypothetical protein